MSTYNNPLNPDNHENAQVIMPLSEEHVYNISDSLIQLNENQLIEIYEFIMKEKNKVRLDFRQIIDYMRKYGHDVIHLLIIMLPYVHWVNFFRHCNILRYYWSEQLIQRIIDQNEMQIQINVLNGSMDHCLVKLSNQYDMNYNFMTKRLAKRIRLLVEPISCLFEQINLNDFFAGTDAILWLGKVRVNPRDNPMDESMIITLYPKTTQCLRQKKDTDFYREGDFLIYCGKQIIVRIYSYVVPVNLIPLIDSGYIDLNNLNDLFCTARFYQYLNNTRNRLFQWNNNLRNKCDLLSYKIKNVVTIDHLIKHKYDKCYCCRKYYDPSIFLKTYESLCMGCAIVSHRFKNENICLKNFVVFITGIRAKIGFATALKILRAGGSVIGTTRYPCFAIQNYMSENDADVWKHRLIIVRCDFTRIDSVYKMLELLKKYKINAFINNAFRTIRPSEWYETNVREIDSMMEEVYYSCNDEPSGTLGNTQQKYIGTEHNVINDPMIDPMIYPNQGIICLSDSKCNQIKFDCMLYNKNHHIIKIPGNIRINQFKDIQDIVHDNSWDQSLGQLDPKEIVECMVINQIVPTLLINQMIERLVEPKFLINVTSLEGQFDTIKNGSHVHTNMCKAALNMLIKSLIGNKKQVHVYTIDPGYVSGICPQNDKYPVHMDDAATRLLFPIIRYFNDGKPLDHGMTKIRNYLPEEW